MKNLIIIGAGGMGREVYNLAMQCNGYGVDFTIKGFLDKKADALEGFEKYYPPVRGNVEDYQIGPDDFFTCSIGNVRFREKNIKTILEKGGQFLSLVHPTALVNPTVKMGIGCLIFPYAQVGSHAVIGDFALIQSYAGIGHDAVIGNYTRVDTHVLCVGGVKIGNGVTIHAGAILNHKVVVEDNSVIGAASFVIKRVKEGTTVFGYPASLLV
jgi:sugar O-acyltransferase (sialic acid O-acetyltransferase NeuD family)